jgi:uncharacterized membrane protein YjjB (DUF3815 family)
MHAVALVFVSATLGAVLRRAIGRHTDNVFAQPFCAALLSGLIGGFAVQHDLSSALRLVAVCPCMILVPGPHLLNGCMDLIDGRIQLAVARLTYAFTTIVAISTGLLIGLALLGVYLPVDPPGRSVPFWQDILAAGAAVAAYAIFFSTPLRMLPWPIVIGMCAHAVRWTAMTVFHFGPATGALFACVFVGLVMTPVARRYHMPFAAAGFASVVSMMPGVFLFRMTSGLTQLESANPPAGDILQQTAVAGATAVAIIVAMGIGLIVPKQIADRFASDVP